MRMSDWSSDVCSSDLGPGRRNPLQLLDLRVLQLDRRRAPEDRHRDLEARALLVDLLDQAVERGEGAVGHPHLLADLEHDRRLRPLDALLHLLQDALGLLGRDRRRLAVAEEAGHLRSEEHTSELQSLMRISYAAFCLKKKPQISKYM